MKIITLPLVSGKDVTIFIGEGNGIAVVGSTKTPGYCRLIDGLHNNGGWEIKLSKDDCVAKIKAALA